MSEASAAARPPTPVWGRLYGETLWRGDVRLRGDVLIPQGSRLKVAPGTRVRAQTGPAFDRVAVERPAFGGGRALTRPDQRHLIVYGDLEIMGEPGDPVRFEAEAVPVLLLGRSRARLACVLFRPADNFAVYCVDSGRAFLADCEFSGGWGGVACGGFGAARLRGCRFFRAQKSGLWAHDDAQIKASGCAVEGNKLGALVEGVADFWSVRGSFRRNEEYGAVVRGSSRLSSCGGLWEGSPVGLLAHGRARVDLRRDELRSNATGIEAAGSSEARLNRVQAHRNETGCWAQNFSRLEAAGGLWSGNGIGIKSSHRSRIRLEAAGCVRQAKAGVFLEEESDAVVSNGSFDENENGVMARGSSRLKAAGCRFRRSRAAALWSEAGCRLELEGNEFRDNHADRHSSGSSADDRVNKI